MAVYVQGKVFWCKLLPDQLTENYDRDGREWTVEFEPDDTSFLKEHKLLDRLKDMDERARKLEREGEDGKAAKVRKNMEGRKGVYLILKKAELTKDGEKNKPIRIVDEDNQPWDDRRIGNGSQVDARLDIKDWGVGKKKSIYLSALRVTNLVPYEDDPFAGMDKAAGKPPKAKPRAKTILEELDGLDDEIPPFDND